MKQLFLLVSFFIFVLKSYSQQENIAFEHYGYEQGLSGPVSQIVQDPFGFIWLGTSDGLNRFDGTAFTTYRNIPGDSLSIPNNIINNLTVDRRGRIWCATNRGLCYYDFSDDRFHTVHFKYELEKIDRHRVYAVVEGASDEIWFATRTLIHVIDKNQIIKSYRLPVSDINFIIKHLYYDQNDLLWIGSNNGVFVYNVNKNTFIHTVVKSIIPEQKNLSVNIHPIVPFIGDTMLAGSWYAGLLKLYIEKDSIRYTYITDTIESDYRRHIVGGISKSDNSVLWVGTYGNGISLYNLSDNKFDRHLHHNPADKESLSSEYINDLFTDSSGITWVGTTAGLDKYDPHTRQFNKVVIPSYPGKFSVYRVPSAIIEDKNDPTGEWLWLTVSGYGLIRFNKITFAFQLFDHDDSNPGSLPDNNVRTLYYDNKSRLWIGSKAGVCIFDHLTKKFVVPDFPNKIMPKNVNGIINDKQGRYWFSTSGYGIYCYDENHSRITSWSFIDGNPESLPDNYIFSMLEDHQGNIWIGTQNNGLCMLNPNSGKFIYFKNQRKDPSSLPDNGVFDLYEDEDQQLWIATENGLGKMDLSGFTIENFNTSHGLSNNCVYSITRDLQGQFWFGTGNGLSRYDGKKKIFKNYFVNDGLSSNRIDGAIYRSTSGTLFFGTSGTINFCNPSMLKINKRIPPVVITGLRIIDKRIPVFRTGHDISPVKLSYSQSMITLDFAALNYTNSFLNQYSYKLEGFDEQWIHSGHKKSATYTNLPGGTYRFVVKAANNDGIWNESGKSVMIIITPPWWRTLWFYILCVVLLASVMYMIYKIRINQLLRLQSIRMRISRDLHDDIGSTLSSINMISSMAARNLNDKINSTEHFKTISSASGEAMDLMNDIVWSVNPENDKMDRVLSRMRQYASETLEAAQIAFTIEMDAECNEIMIPVEKRKHFYLIFKESVNNLAKYSNAKNASIRICCRNKIIQLIIRDNGKGFNIGNPNLGNGLRNVKSRADLLKGTINISSSPESGTQTDLKFPLSP